LEAEVWRNRKLPIGVVLLAVVLILSACSGGEKSPQTPAELGLASLTNDLAGGSLTKSHILTGEKFKFITGYDTAYNARSWRITDSKTIHFQAGIELLPGGEGVQVMIEHVHVDVNLQGDKAGLDGMPQDSMDDSIHAGDQPGFLVTPQYIYEDVFVIEGLSQTLINGWGFATGGTGTSEVSQERLTEKHLRSNGVKGNKFSFVYDVLIKYPGEPGFHKRIVVDEFLVQTVA
jgi:hypothetical protein